MSSDAPPIIGLCGYARTGKDTVGDALRDHGYRRAAWADKLREALLALNPTVTWLGAAKRAHLADVIESIGWERAKTEAPEVRGLLQRLGTDVGRAFFGDDIWIRLAVDAITGPTVFTDCRFPNECDKIRQLGGQIWRVHRPGVDAANAHVSETALDDYRVDRVIYNNGTLHQLRASIKTAVDALWVDVSSATDISSWLAVTRSKFTEQIAEGNVFHAHRRRPVDEYTFPAVQRWHE